MMKFEIEAKVENDPDTQLYPGFSTVAEMLLDKRGSVLTIKERNLIFKNDSIYVELLDQDNRINKRLVKIGLSDGLRIKITEGLSLGDKVKMQANQKLTPSLSSYSNHSVTCFIKNSEE